MIHIQLLFDGIGSGCPENFLPYWRKACRVLSIDQATTRPLEYVKATHYQDGLPAVIAVYVYLARVFAGYLLFSLPIYWRA